MAVTLTRGIVLLTIAITSWSLSPLLIVRTKGLAPAPVFVAMLAVCIGALFALIGTSASRDYRPWALWQALRSHGLLGAAFLLGTGAFVVYPVLYFSAIQSGPPVLINLINYLWPIVGMVIVLVRQQSERSLELVIGGAFGFAGAALAISKGVPAPSSLTLGSLAPFALAAAAALVYGSVSAYMRTGHAPMRMAAPKFLLSALLMAGTTNAIVLVLVQILSRDWMKLDVTNARVSGLLLYAALLPLAHLCWLTAIQNRRVPSFAAAYVIPVAATALLAAATEGRIPPETISALVLVLCGIAFASSSDRGVPVAFAVLLAALGSVQISQALHELAESPEAAARGVMSEVMVSLVAIFGGFVLSNAISRYHAVQRACAEFYSQAAQLAVTSPTTAQAHLDELDRTVMEHKRQPDNWRARIRPSSDLPAQWTNVEFALANRVSRYEWLVLTLGSGGLLVALHLVGGGPASLAMMLLRALATAVIVGVLFAVRDYDLHRPDRLVQTLLTMRSNYHFPVPPDSVLWPEASAARRRYPPLVRLIGLTTLVCFSALAIIQNGGS